MERCPDLIVKRTFLKDIHNRNEDYGDDERPDVIDVGEERRKRKQYPLIPMRLADEEAHRYNREDNCADDSRYHR